MGHAPVYFTVAQVQFNPILSFEAVLPVIQDELRKAGYPDFEARLAPSVRSSTMEGGLGAQQQNQYVFSNMETTRGFVLEVDRLLIQATEYDSFEPFSRELLEMLELVNSAVALTYFDQVGLRYLDAVVPRAGEDLTDYLVEEMRGLYGKLEGRLAHTFCETMTLTTAGAIMSRVIIQNGRLSFPPDMQPVGLAVADRFLKIEGLHATLDTDGLYETREPFDLTAIAGRLAALHDDIVKSFVATVTPHALKVWE
jgi:uncharacterized protein (TIGR04255 family)